MMKEKNNDKVVLIKIGKHLAELRKSRGLTQRQLGEKIYAGEKTISKWERGMIAPDITMIKQLSDFYNVSADEILSGEKKEVYNGNTTIDAINVYSNQTKHKVLKKVLVVFLLIVIFFITVFLIDRHYRWKVENFKTSGSFRASGYVFSNAEESKIVFKDLYYDDLNSGTEKEVKTYWLKLSVYSNNEEICVTQSEYENKRALYDILDKYIFVCESNKRLNLNDLSLHIEYYNNQERNEMKLVLKR